MKTVALIEDDADLHELLRYNLQKEGFRMVGHPSLARAPNANQLAVRLLTRLFRFLGCDRVSAVHLGRQFLSCRERKARIASK